MQLCRGTPVCSSTCTGVRALGSSQMLPGGAGPLCRSFLVLKQVEHSHLLNWAPELLTCTSVPGLLAFPNLGTRNKNLRGDSVQAVAVPKLAHTLL